MYTNWYRTALQALIKFTEYNSCLSLPFPCKFLVKERTHKIFDFIFTYSVLNLSLFSDLIKTRSKENLQNQWIILSEPIFNNLWRHVTNMLNKKYFIEIILKVSKFQNEFMMSSFLSKRRTKILRISALAFKKCSNKKKILNNYIK